MGDCTKKKNKEIHLVSGTFNFNINVNRPINIYIYKAILN